MQGTQENFRKNIRVVMLDVDNTLLDFDRCTVACAEFAAEKFQIVLPEDWETTFHRINNGLWNDLEKGLLTVDDIHRIRWGKVLHALGEARAEEVGADFEKAFVEQLKYEAFPVEGALELMQYLSKKYLLCVGSNGPQDQQFSRLRIAGMLPLIGEEQVFTSGEVGCSKPQKGFFDVCMERLRKKTGECSGEKSRLLPENIVMIGDSLTADIGGAKDYGLKTIWFDFGNKGSDAPGADKADVRVETLKEIEKIL